MDISCGSCPESCNACHVRVVMLSVIRKIVVCRPLSRRHMSGSTSTLRQ